jgi:hypothetical protein
MVIPMLKLLTMVRDGLFNIRQDAPIMVVMKATGALCNTNNGAIH